MKLNLSNEPNLTVQGLVDYLEAFFDSAEGKGIKSIDQVFIKFGYRIYFQLFPMLTDDSIEKGKFRGFKFSIDTDLKADEIEILKDYRIKE